MGNSNCRRAASCLRLVSAILMELSDEWESSNSYLKPELLR
ncbi:MAG: hypothetical protein NT164_01720 [Verrucomicrobiae bacterium]|nr:hypothetical protein [Verrucomicrobiae bacterium]